MKKYLVFTISMLSISSFSFGCACGCGIFEISMPTMIPTNEQSSAFLHYSFMNQDIAWHNTSKVDKVYNADKTIRTNFITFGYQKMFNRKWGVRIEIPFWDRYFETDVNGTPGQIDQDLQISSTENFTLSDIRIMGIYSGFSPDMSSGVLFGAILPTGPYHVGQPIEDRDTQPGYGSIGSLVGFYHFGHINSSLQWFTNFLWRHNFYAVEDYKPGDSFNFSIGSYFTSFLSTHNIAPFIESIVSIRNRDDGGNADPEDSGFQRVYLAPGIEYKFSHFSFSAEVAIPVYTHVNGYQLVAPFLLSSNLSYSF